MMYRPACNWRSAVSVSAGNIIGYIYELPFGKGRQFLNGLPGPANTNQFGGRSDRIGDGNLGAGDMRD